MRRPGRQGWTTQQFRDRRAALKAQAKYCAAAKAKLKKMSGNPPSQAVRLRSREKHPDRRKNHHKRGESAASQAAPGHTLESLHADLGRLRNPTLPAASAGTFFDQKPAGSQQGAKRGNEKIEKRRNTIPRPAW